MTAQLPSLEPVVFERLGQTHVPQLALFHSQNLGGQLTWLGPSFIRYFYETSLKLPGTFGWGSFRKDELVGFVFGSADGESLLKRIIQKNPLQWGAHSLRSALIHPFRFSRVAWGLLQGLFHGVHSEQPELHYIAVRADQRGRHMGGKLLHYFCTELSARGPTHFELSVGRDNREALRFYEANGGQVIGDYETAGLKMKRFSFSVQRILNKEGPLSPMDSPS